MTHWNAEADVEIPTSTQRNNDAEAPRMLASRQPQRDERYDLHNFIVLDNLLKDHLNLR